MVGCLIYERACLMRERGCVTRRCVLLVPMVSDKSGHAEHRKKNIERLQRVK